MNESIKDVLRNSLREAKKILIKTTPGNDKEAVISKYPITGRKVDNYKRGTWSWILGMVDKWGDKSRKPKLEIRVLAWDLNGQPAHESLGQVFTPSNAKEARQDVKVAKQFAKSLIADGAAKMSEVEGRVKMTYEKDQLVRFGTFEPEESM